jgi:hypothetical protein
MTIAVKDRLPTSDGKYLPGEEPDDYYDPAWDNEDDAWGDYLYYQRIGVRVPKRLLEKLDEYMEADNG